MTESECAHCGEPASPGWTIPGCGSDLCPPAASEQPICGFCREMGHDPSSALTCGECSLANDAWALGEKYLPKALLCRHCEGRKCDECDQTGIKEKYR